MTISVVHATSATGTSTSTLAVTISSTTAGNTLVAVLMGSCASGWFSGAAVTLGSSGDTWTPLGVGQYPSMAVFADSNCSSGQTTVTFTYSASGTTGVVAYVYEISGLGSTVYLDQNCLTPSGSGTTLFPAETMTSGYIQTSQANAILIGAGLAEYDTSTPTLTGPGGSWTNETGHSYTGTTNGYAISGYQVVSSTGTYQYNPTFTTATRAMGGIFALAAGPFDRAPTMVQSGSNVAAGSNTPSFACFQNYAAAGSFIVAEVMAYAYTGTSPTISSVDIAGGGQAMTAAAGPSTATTGYPTTGIYYYQNIPGSDCYGVTVNLTGSTAADVLVIVYMYELNNMPTSGTAVDVTAHSSGSSTAISSGATGTSTRANEFVAGLAAWAGPNTVTVTPPASPWSSGDTNVDVSASFYGVLLGANQIGQGFQTYTLSATLGTSEDWVAQVAAFFGLLYKGPAFYPATRAIRANPPARSRRAGVYMGSALKDTSFGTGQVQWNAGGPVRNPTPGPVFTPISAKMAIRARIPRPRLAGIYMGESGQDTSFGTGQIQWNSGAPVQNPTPGPVFVQKPRPVRFIPPPWRPRAGRIGSSFGAPVINPIHGPPVYAPHGPVRPRIPRPFAGSITAGSSDGNVRAALNGSGFGNGIGSAGAPARNPGTGPVFRQAVSPARVRLTLPPRGRVASNAGAPVPVAPSVGPVFHPARQAARARYLNQVYVLGNPGLIYVNSRDGTP